MKEGAERYKSHTNRKFKTRTEHTEEGTKGKNSHQQIFKLQINQIIK